MTPRPPSPLAAGLLFALVIFAPFNLVHAATEPESWPPRSGDARPAAAPPQSDVRLYVLAFSDATISQVADDVLGAVLGQTFSVDPALQGTMSLHIEQRLTPAQLLAEFEAALNRSGGAINRQGGRLLLVPQTSTAPVARLVAKPSAVSSTADPIEAGRAAARPWLVLSGFAAAGAVLAMLGLLRLLSSSRSAPMRLAIGRPPSSSRHALLDHLLATCVVAPDALDRARRIAARSRRPVESVLHQMGAVTDTELVEAYAAVTGCAIWRPLDQPVLDGQNAPEGLLERGFAPIACSPRRLTVATSDPLDDEAIAEVARETSRTVEIMVGSPADMALACRSADPSVIPYDPGHNRASA